MKNRLLIYLFSLGSIFATMNIWAQSLPLDVIIPGNEESEKDHSLDPYTSYNESRRLIVDNKLLSETYEGQMGQTARRFLPFSDTTDDSKYANYYYGGEMSFTMKIDPVEQNYFTAKFSGDEVGSERFVLCIQDEQGNYREIGMRYGEDRDEGVFYSSSENEEPASAGAFIYRTMFIPKQMTEGKTEARFKIRTTGQFSNYGTGTYDSHQKKLTTKTRGVYRVYTHTNPMFTLPEDDLQGKTPSYRDAAVASYSRDEATLFSTIKANLNQKIFRLIRGNDNVPQYLNNNYSEIEFLAVAYGKSWVTESYREEIPDKVVRMIDEHSKGYIEDQSRVNAWGGAFGRPAYAMCLLYDEIKERLEEIVDFGEGNKTRREYWADIFYASLNYGRKDSRTITNQAFERVGSIYGANKALLLIDPDRAMPEEKAMDYILETIGVNEWRGVDLNDDPVAERITNYELGKNYYMMTKMGTTRENGWSSQSSYGDLGPKLVEIYEMCGDERVLEVALQHSLTQNLFHYPSVTAAGTRVIRSEDIISWRNQHIPGRTYYGDPWVAYATGNETLIGYVKQMIDDKYFLTHYDYSASFESKYLHFPDIYEAFKDIDNTIVNACTPGQPDYLVVDPENAVLMLKRGSEQLAVQLYRRSRAINRRAIAHLLDSKHERIIEFVPEDVRFRESGEVLVREANVHHPACPEPPDRPVNASYGEVMPKPLMPDGNTYTQRGIANFYACTLGDYLIVINSSERTWDETFEYTMPEGYKKVYDMKQGKYIDCPEKLILEPGDYYVYYLKEGYDPVGIEKETITSQVSYYVNNDQLIINNLEGNEVIELFDLQGHLEGRYQANGTETVIPWKRKGIALMKIESIGKVNTYKIINR